MAVYFVQVGARGPIKIGSARNVYYRFKDLQTANHQELRLLGAVVDWGVEEERALHARFAKHRVRGEWFRPDADLRAHIAILMAREESAIHEAIHAAWVKIPATS